MSRNNVMRAADAAPEAVAMTMSVSNVRAARLAAAVTLLLCGLPALAEDAPRLTVTESGPLRAGELKDGQRLAQGVLFSQDVPDGFQVWSEAPLSGNQTAGYTLSGGQNGGNALRVRLQRDGWTPAAPGGKGISTPASGNTAGFDVVVDGNQTVTADRYRLDLRATAVTTAAGAPQAGPVEIQAVDILAAAPVSLTHTLTAARPSFGTSLPDGTLLANGSVRAQDGSAQIFALRWTPGSGDITGNRNVVHGKNNAGATVTMQMDFTGAQAQADGWYSAPAAATSLTYTVRATGSQTAPAGTYVASVDAAVWTE